MNDLIDGNGIRFADCRDCLPTLARDFPLPQRKTDLRVRRDYRERFTCCQLCGRDFPLRGEWRHVHHIVGGWTGRSDEPANFLCVHARCHEKIHAGTVSLAEVLWAKWETDQENTDWHRLSLLKGEVLPEPRKAAKAEEDPPDA